MVWLLLACNGSPSVVAIAPSGATAPLPSEPAWAKVRPLDGAQRLFGGPFRCRLPDGTVVDFHPNGMARGEPSFRGRWTHRGQELRVDARQDAVQDVRVWSYVPYTHDGDWVLATRDGALACRPGHEAEPGPAGAWVQVLDAGGDTARAARALSAAQTVVFAVDGDVVAPEEGLTLRHRPGVAARAVAQRLADGLQEPVSLVVDAELEAPLQLRVGR